jgi:hypothetical protein
MRACRQRRVPCRMPCSQTNKAASKPAHGAGSRSGQRSRHMVQAAPLSASHGTGAACARRGTSIEPRRQQRFITQVPPHGMPALVARQWSPLGRGPLHQRPRQLRDRNKRRGLGPRGTRARSVRSRRPHTSSAALILYPAACACRWPRCVSGTCGSGVKMYAKLSTLPWRAQRTLPVSDAGPARRRGLAGPAAGLDVSCPAAEARDGARSPPLTRRRVENGSGARADLRPALLSSFPHDMTPQH